MAEKIITLECAICLKSFERKAAEHKRNQKKGRKALCSRNCTGKNNIKNLEGARIVTDFLKKGSAGDKYSPYRYYLKKSKSRNKKKGLECDISLEYLHELWNNQNGICVLTGKPMYLPKNTVVYQNEKLSPNWASLDRIDPERPYEKGNVRFISYMANMCKHTFSDKDVIEFCRLVVENDKAI